MSSYEGACKFEFRLLSYSNSSATKLVANRNSFEHNHACRSECPAGNCSCPTFAARDLGMPAELRRRIIKHLKNGLEPHQVLKRMLDEEAGDSQTTVSPQAAMYDLQVIKNIALREGIAPFTYQNDMQHLESMAFEDLQKPMEKRFFRAFKPKNVCKYDPERCFGIPPRSTLGEYDLLPNAVLFTVFMDESMLKLGLRRPQKILSDATHGMTNYTDVGVISIMCWDPDTGQNAHLAIVITDKVDARTHEAAYHVIEQSLKEYRRLVHTEANVPQAHTPPIFKPQVLMTDIQHSERNALIDYLIKTSGERASDPIHRKAVEKQLQWHWCAFHVTEAWKRNISRLNSFTKKASDALEKVRSKPTKHHKGIEKVANEKETQEVLHYLHTRWSDLLQSRASQKKQKKTRRKSVPQKFTPKPEDLVETMPALGVSATSPTWVQILLKYFCLPSAIPHTFESMFRDSRQDVAQQVHENLLAMCMKLLRTLERIISACETGCHTESNGNGKGKQTSGTKGHDFPRYFQNTWQKNHQHWAIPYRRCIANFDSSLEGGLYLDTTNNGVESFHADWKRNWLRGICSKYISQLVLDLIGYRRRREASQLRDAHLEKKAAAQLRRAHLNPVQGSGVETDLTRKENPNHPSSPTSEENFIFNDDNDNDNGNDSNSDEPGALASGKRRREETRDMEDPRVTKLKLKEDLVRDFANLIDLMDLDPKNPPAITSTITKQPNLTIEVRIKTHQTQPNPKPQAQTKTNVTKLTVGKTTRKFSRGGFAGDLSKKSQTARNSRTSKNVSKRAQDKVIAGWAS